MSPCDAAATRWAPVASEATADQGWPVAAVPAVSLVQVAPESLDVQRSPELETKPLPGAMVAATRWDPSELDATETQT